MAAYEPFRVGHRYRSPVACCERIYEHGGSLPLGQTFLLAAEFTKVYAHHRRKSLYANVIVDIVPLCVAACIAN